MHRVNSTNDIWEKNTTQCIQLLMMLTFPKAPGLVVWLETQQPHINADIQHTLAFLLLLLIFV